MRMLPPASLRRRRSNRPGAGAPRAARRARARQRALALILRGEPEQGRVAAVQDLALVRHAHVRVPVACMSSAASPNSPTACLWPLRASMEVYMTSPVAAP